MPSARERYQPLSTRDVAALLASTLGWEKSEELVHAIADAAGYDAQRLTPDQAVTILDALSRQQGLVGVTARFALSRADTLRQRRPLTAPRPVDDHIPLPMLHLPPDPTPVSGIQRTPASLPEAMAFVQPFVKRLPVGELVTLLAPTIGQEKAAESIAFAVRLKGIHDENLTQDQALAVFEVLAADEGLVGVTARFAKARLMLRYRG